MSTSYWIEMLSPSPIVTSRSAEGKTKTSDKAGYKRLMLSDSWIFTWSEKNKLHINWISGYDPFWVCFVDMPNQVVALC